MSIKVKGKFYQVDSGVVVCPAIVIVDVVSFSGSGDVAPLHSALHLLFKRFKHVYFVCRFCHLLNQHNQFWICIWIIINGTSFFLIVRFFLLL